MRELLKKILLEKHFLIENYPFDNEEAFQANRTDNNGFDFLTVIFIDEEKISNDILTQYMSKLFDIVSIQNEQIMGWDKNLSLLIVMKVNDLNISSEIQSLIFDIEEDPFMFKKYILPYTDKQEEIFTSQFADYDGDKVSLFLDYVLYDSENFSVFKNRDESEKYLLYDLVSKLFIKLPYLNIVNQNKEMETLMDGIIEGFTEEEKELWAVLMELKRDEGDNPDIEKILETVGVNNDE